jgi:phage-related tail fiber protein
MSGSIGSNSSGNLELYSGTTKVLTADASTGIISFVKTPTVPTPAAGANDTQVATTAFVAAAVPAGSVGFFAMAAAPTSWLKANGAAISRTTYASLFAAIGTTFGTGDGSTTFNLPDLRGEFLRVWDDGRTVDNGRVFGTWQDHAVQSHTHNVKRNGNATSGSDGSGFAATSYDGNNSGPITTYTQSGNVATETRPRNIALLACIKY